MEEPRVLKFLRDCDDRFVSGEEMAEALSISRAAVWKDIENLRRLGYAVAAIPNRGYRLVAKPDCLYPWEVQADLATSFVGRELFYFRETDSTNNQAKKLLKTATPAEGAAVVAETQLAGKGRLGRQWFSPAGAGIWTSIILHPALPVADMAKLTIMVAVAVRRAVLEATGLELVIKWPNDLLWAGRKVCGILAELGGEVDRLAFLVVGIGLNVNQVAEDFPEELRETAGSLRLAAGRSLDRVVLLQALFRQVEACYLQVLKEGFAGILEDCRRYSATLGQRLTVREGARTLTGVARGIGDDGGLQLELTTGELVTVYSGDTTLSV